MFDLPHLDLPPLRGAAGTVRLPGSKSISNRVLLLAGLSQGTTLVRELLASDDTRVMRDALRTLGCRLEDRADGALAITGLGGRLQVHEAALFLGNAGTAMRPLAAALAVLAALQGGAFTLSGVARMHERPIGDLVDALVALGCGVSYLGTPGYPPLRLHGQAGGALQTGREIPVRGDVSSQFLTALLLALPLASDAGAITIAVSGELISKPYVEITLNLLARFGIAVQREGWQRFTIPAGSRYRTPGEIHVEADASSASYFVALGAIAATDQPLVIEGVGLDSIQGDIRFIEAAQAMGAQVQGEPGRLLVRRGAWPLRAITLDCNHIPDAAMTLAVMALYAEGSTRLTNIASWRVKETDRIAAMAAELRKLGASVVEEPDAITVTPPTAGAWRPAAIHTYDDHRIAMCFSLAAFHPLAGDGTRAAPMPVRILDPKCVAKTFPEYFEALFSVAQARTDEIPVITIDGPTASGKGTLAAEVAARLGWHQLDSGLLYRATALAAQRQGVAADDEAAVAAVAAALKLRFDGERVLLTSPDGHATDVAAALRQEQVGSMASRIAALPAVRAALEALQLGFRALPGLVADGRDMGTVIFPAAPLKLFLTASAAMRAERRHKQLISKGISATLADLRADLEARDERDRSRTVAPLKPAEDALLLDNSGLSIETSVDRVLSWWDARGPFATGQA
ncbi:bifunctional 3-phosphoshikimate 1-carboxyvinyltransferase/cytidylate kinase [Aquabacterium sp. OR-4]|uniref:bifunctional 3-phosphoshikimate 1-carboxyvinyltransferase/cytidylate kinase n=1 Tax=Aquabacterium sp. OR-4 TaxID=2978127 RepID=UPI0021B3553D|nr:bifunctional 3-phosphoshikimate 1-carboxyvinyltransferase/cytidylate kinase [Aquabacterium sp. OR-4]MDT7836834.1 bifunctional 3-phosphoshikimate 1-carboxyvinyltransferase/cytidylate kinase [Aquabacterium sp. OR-4]